MLESRGGGNASRTSLKQLCFLGGTLGVLCGIATTYSDGAIGFMQGVVEHHNAYSIALLVSIIGLLFVLLYKLGFSFESVEDIESAKAA